MSHQNTTYAQSVVEWKRAARELARMRQSLAPEQVFDLRYEDLCDKPVDWMSRLWQWLEIEDISVNEIGFKEGEYHILGNMMRLNSVSSIRLDEKWRRLLSQEDLSVFEKHAGGLNRSLGYD